MISDEPIVKKVAWASGTRRAGASMETHREYVGYLDEWDGTERLTDEEIVRCRDCAKWSFFDTEDGKRIGYCSEWTHLDGFSHATNEDGFCAWGERSDK